MVLRDKLIMAGIAILVVLVALLAPDQVVLAGNTIQVSDGLRALLVVLGVVIGIVAASVKTAASHQGGQSAEEHGVAAGGVVQQGSGNLWVQGDINIEAPPPPPPITLQVQPAKVRAPAEGTVEIIPASQEPSRYGHQEEIRLVVRNNSSFQMLKSFVHLEEVARRPTDDREGEFEALEGLPSGDSLHWVEHFEVVESFQCDHGSEIAAHGRRTVVLMIHETNVRNQDGERQVSFAGHVRYCDHWEDNNLAHGFDYRMRLQLSAMNMEPALFDVYLVETAGGFWVFERLERIVIGGQ